MTLNLIKILEIKVSHTYFIILSTCTFTFIHGIQKLIYPCFVFVGKRLFCPIDFFSVCEPGYYRLSLFNDCQLCPKNTYSDKDQTYSSCTPCPEGTTTPTTAASSASDCRKQRQFNTIHIEPLIQKDTK